MQHTYTVFPYVAEMNFLATSQMKVIWKHDMKATAGNSLRLYISKLSKKFLLNFIT